MRISRRTLVGAALFVAIGTPLVLAQPVLAADADIEKTKNFIKALIGIAAGLSGLVATGTFVVGGFAYMTSTGNIERHDRAKATIRNGAVGVMIVGGAYVFANILTDLAIKYLG